jgi:hypothetical protein
VDLTLHAEEDVKTMDVEKAAVLLAAPAVTVLLAAVTVLLMVEVTTEALTFSGKCSSRGNIGIWTKYGILKIEFF